MSESPFASLDDAELDAARSRIEAEQVRRNPPPESAAQRQIRRAAELAALEADPSAQASMEDVADADSATVARWLNEGRLVGQGYGADRRKRR